MQAMLHTLANLGLLSLIIAAAYGMGFLLLHLLNPPHLLSERLPRVLWALLLGLGCLSYATLLIGLAGVLYPWVVWMLLGAGIFALVPAWKLSLLQSADAAGHRLASWLKTLPGGWSRIELVGLGLLTIFVLFNLMVALAPPLTIDDLTYHLAVPKRYVADHAIRYMPDIYYSNLPFTMEMLYTLSLALGSLGGAQLINWLNSLVVLGWIVVLARKAGLGRREMLLACLLFYAITTVSDQARSANVEIGGTAFLLGALAALLTWRDTFAAKWLILGGTLAGLYAGAKLPNPLLVALLAVWVLIVAWRSVGWRSALLGLAVFSGVAATVVGVWYLRAWWMTGNPTYPYLIGVFGGPPINPYWRSNPYRVGETGEIVGKFLQSFPGWKVLFQPWFVTMQGTEFRGWIGPVYLAFLPAVLFSIKRYDKFLRNLLLFCGLLMLFWLQSYKILRAALPLFALLSIPVAVETLRFAHWRLHARLVVAAMLVLWLGFSLSRAWIDVLPAAQVAIGLKSRDDYVSDRGPVRNRFNTYDAYRYMNEHLPEDAKVLLWDSRGLYLDRSYLRVLEFMYDLSTPERLADAEPALAELRRFGITHVSMTDEFLRRWFRRVLEESGQLDCLYQSSEMVVCAVWYPDEADSLSQGQLRSEQTETAGDDRQ